jgi:UDP-galactopyranose mutase
MYSRSDRAAEMELKMHNLIVGAGFSGATCARLLADAGQRCTVIDRRPHIAGNAYDHLDAQGVMVHAYGPHIFHTNSERIFAWLSRFTTWRPYEHRVRARVRGQAWPIPINRSTINGLYGLNLDEAGVQAFLDAVRVPCAQPRTSEDAVLAAVGPELCDLFFRGYTRKQWGLDLSELDASVASRIPTRTNDDDRYFTDRFQAMPAEGYTRLFERMLDHPLIDVQVGLAYEQAQHQLPHNRLIYTGPIDAYFRCVHGALPYRSLRFEHLHLPGVSQYQEVGTVNEPQEHDWTRTTEFKHLTGQAHAGTSIVREFPCAEGEPYYPIPNDGNRALLARYEALAEQETGVHFLGRLAQYRYYNMDQAVGAAMSLAQDLIKQAALDKVVC